MQLGLHSNGKREAFTFEPSDHKWKTQGAGSAYLVGVATGLAPPVDTIFLKRWINGYAPAQRLLMGAIRDPLPATPRVIGHGVEGKDHFYALQNLTGYGLLEEVVTKPVGAAAVRAFEALLLKNDIGGLVTSAAAELFEETNRRGFVYPDFCIKNIMVDRRNWKVSFIDLDSSFEVSALPEQSETAGSFSIVYWGAWRHLGFAAALKRGEIEPSRAAGLLSRTMVLSFAAVVARATAMFRTEVALDDVKVILRSPSFPQAQEAFWASVAAGNVRGVQTYFGLEDASVARGLCERWKPLVDRLRARELIPWPEVSQLADEVLTVAREAKVKAPRQPLQTGTAAPLQPVPGRPAQPSPAPVSAAAQTRAASNRPEAPTGLAWARWACLSMSGRLNRIGFIGSQILQGMAVFAMALAVTAFEPELSEDAIGVIALALAVMAGYSSVAVLVKRGHDLGLGFIATLAALAAALSTALISPQAAAISYGVIQVIGLLAPGAKGRNAFDA